MNATKPQITWNAQLSASIVNEVIRRLIAGKFDVLEPLPRGLMLQTLWEAQAILPKELQRNNKSLINWSSKMTPKIIEQWKDTIINRVEIKPLTEKAIKKEIDDKISYSLLRRIIAEEIDKALKPVLDNLNSLIDLSLSYQSQSDKTPFVPVADPIDNIMKDVLTAPIVVKPKLRKVTIIGLIGKSVGVINQEFGNRLDITHVGEDEINRITKKFIKTGSASDNTIILMSRFPIASIKDILAAANKKNYLQCEGGLTNLRKMLVSLENATNT